MSKIPRNQPCPCGSGKKYKRCCLGKPEQGSDLERAPQLHAQDRRLIDDILQWAETAEPDAYNWTLGMCGFEDESSDVFDDAIASALATVTGQSDLTLARRFLVARSGHLLDQEVTWLRAVIDAWLGLWEVLEVRRGRGVRVRDLLTNETREVLDVSLSGSIGIRSVLCARVVDFEGLSLFVCTHPISLRPSQVEEVLGPFLLDEDGPLHHSPDLLRGENANELLRLWHSTCQKYSTPRLPSLQNRDGDVLQHTTDSLTFDPADRAEIISLLGALDDAKPDQGDGGTTHFSFVRPSDQTILGSARVSGAELQLETNSDNRADALLTRMQEVLGERVTFVDRDRRDMQDFMASGMGKRASAATDADVGLQGPEVDAMLLRYKTEQYATWPDTPLPMLNGLTAREGMKTPKLRRLIVATIKDMEGTESSIPEGQRYDFGIIRKTLGIPADD